MKKRIKNACKVRRYYASGIPMYRHRHELVEVPAGKMVSVIKIMTSNAICQFGDLVVAIPLENFAGEKLVKEKEKTNKTDAPAADKPAKTPAKKSKKSKSKKPKTVEAEETPVEAPVVNTTAPIVEQATETQTVQETAPAETVEMTVV